LNNDGKPKPGDEGGFGARRVFNSLGLPVELISLGKDGQLATNSVGVAKTTFTYDHQGNLTQLVRLGSDGKPVLGSDGVAEERLVYDPYGNVKEVASYGKDGQLVTLKDPGVSGMAFAYDGQGNIIENTYFGSDRQLVRGPLGFAKYTAVWDGNGGVLQSFFSPDGKQALITGRAVKIRGRYDERGYLDTNGTPMITQVTVDKVEPDSKSYRIGLQVGDLILNYDAQEVPDTRVFWELELVRGERPRELRIERDGKVVSLDVPPGCLTGLEIVNKVPSGRKK
jgi:YD repeat-containing protein